jgi:hypothetical protein
MAFDPMRLQPLSGVSGSEGTRFWKYTHTDTIHEIIADDYFDDGGGNSVFNIGDTVMIISVDDLVNPDRATADTYFITITDV